MNELGRFTKAMDGEWRVESLLRHDSGRTIITYCSLSDPDMRWSHIAFPDSEIPRVGTVGRIGFIGKGGRDE